jgi:hypothetical protein
MKWDARSINWPLGLVGAVVGGALGYLAFFWMARQGFYALVLPGFALGLGCGLLSRGKAQVLGLVCGVLGVTLALITEWRRAPFAADDSLPYFLTHVGDLKQFTLISIGLSGLFAYWFGMGRADLFRRRDLDARHEEKDGDADKSSQP